MMCLRLNYEFTVGILEDNIPTYNRCLLKLQLFPNTNDSIDQNVAIERINYFIREVVEHALIADENNSLVGSAVLPILVVPMPGAYDQVLQFVICAKINAIIGDKYRLAESTFSSEIGGHVEYQYFFDSDDGSISQVLSRDPLCWWNDSGLRFVTYESEESLKEHHREREWSEFDLHWSDEREEHSPLEVSDEELDDDDDDSIETANIIRVKRPENEN